MTMRNKWNIAAMTMAATMAAAAALMIGGLAHASGGHDDDGDDDHGVGMDQMREMHRGHAHGHDFEAMEKMSPAERQRVMSFMSEVGIALPPMDSHRGRELFVQKGCVACHEVNGVGGDLGPELNADDLPQPMNAFEFAARMWRGAQAMTALQEDMLGEVISLDGQDLADIIAFAHDAEEQKELTADQIPEKYLELIEQ